ncbi:MAG: CPBP family intramembrane metalloprotease [Chloroflexi bacterium]|nr:CPBP family intramembrane metalloprotease [Chloroflexota bacterium]
MTMQSATFNRSQSHDNATIDSSGIEQYSIARSLVLHLLPGVLVVSLYVATAPLAMQWGFPPTLAMMLGTLLILLAFELGHLLWEGKRRNGKWSLEGIVLNRESMPIRQYLIWIPVFVIAAYIVYFLTVPLDMVLIGLLSWLPKWFVLTDVSQLAQYSKSALTITFWVYLTLNGIVFPIIEELYFRGYLMPRLSRFGRGAPVLNHLLFTIYHFWTPYSYGTIFFGVLPLTIAVWWKRNIKIGIITHCALNIIGTLLTFGQVLGS